MGLELLFTYLLSSLNHGLLAASKFREKCQIARYSEGSRITVSIEIEFQALYAGVSVVSFHIRIYEAANRGGTPKFVVDLLRNVEILVNGARLELNLENATICVKANFGHVCRSDCFAPHFMSPGFICPVSIASICTLLGRGFWRRHNSTASE